MQIIAVIDIQASRPVIAIAGERASYKPIPNCAAGAAGVVALAQDFRSRWGINRLYLADLDAIAGAPPQLDTFAELRAAGFDVWVDAGVRDLRDASRIAEAGAGTIVAGLETISGPGVLQALVAEFGDRLVFSLDLKNGQCLGDLSEWDSPEPSALATQAVALGARRLLILDLARVGMNNGVGTDILVERLLTSMPRVAAAVGGGVRDGEDLKRLEARGVQSVLIGSALRSNRLTPDDVLKYL